MSREYQSIRLSCMKNIDILKTTSVSVESSLFFLPFLSHHFSPSHNGNRTLLPLSSLLICHFDFSLSLVLMKLTRAANLTPKSRVQTIFLPSSSHIRINPSFNMPAPASSSSSTTTSATFSYSHHKDDELFDRNENYLRKMETTTRSAGQKQQQQPNLDAKYILDKIKQINLNEVARRSTKGKFRLEDGNNNNNNQNATAKPPSIITKKHKRRNDKFLHRRPTNPEDYELFMSVRDRERPSSIDYYDCMTAGWGKFSSSGDLSDVLLKIDVPIHNIKR